MYMEIQRSLGQSPLLVLESLPVRPELIRGGVGGVGQGWWQKGRSHCLVLLELLIPGASHTQQLRVSHSVWRLHVFFITNALDLSEQMNLLSMVPRNVASQELGIRGALVERFSGLMFSRSAVTGGGLSLTQGHWSYVYPMDYSDFMGSSQV